MSLWFSRYYRVNDPYDVKEEEEIEEVFELKIQCIDVLVETAIERWIQQHRGDIITKLKVRDFIKTIYSDNPMILQLVDEDLELYDDFDIEFDQPKTLVDLATSQLYPQVIKGWQQSIHNYTLDEYLASLYYRLAEKECIVKKFKLNKRNNKKIFTHLPI